MSKSLIETVGSEVRTLNGQARKLRYLSDNAYGLGMQSLGDQLLDIAINIEMSAEVVYNAVSDDLSRQVKRSQEASANMLKAALAGVIVAKKGDK